MRIEGINIDLSPHFWIGLVIFATTGISGGAIHLTKMIPADWIEPVTAWSAFIAFIGSGYLVGALGLHNADPAARRALVVQQPGTVVVTTDGDTKDLANRLAPIREVKSVISTPEIAAATPSDKVVTGA